MYPCTSATSGIDTGLARVQFFLSQKNTFQMKKIFFLFTIAFASLTSCTNTNHVPNPSSQQFYYPGTETTLVDSCRDIITVATPFTTCDGRRSIYPSKMYGNWSYHRTTITSQGRPVGTDSMVTIVPIVSNSDESGITGGLMNWSVWPLLAGILWALLWLVLGLGALWILWRLFSSIPWKNLCNSPDPVTSGSPMVPGGVSPSSAYTHMQTVAQRQYGVLGPIRNIRRGRFYGSGDVFYMGKSTGKKRTMNGQFGYSGEITDSEGRTNTVYFLEGCGNDVRQGNYVTNLRFVPEGTQPEIPTPPAPVTRETSTFETKEVTMELTKNECKCDVQLRMLQIAEKLAENGRKKVYMKLTDNGGLELNITDNVSTKETTDKNSTGSIDLRKKDGNK
jgi:hypothetical protein